MSIILDELDTCLAVALAMLSSAIGEAVRALDWYLGECLLSLLRLEGYKHVQ